MRRFQSVIAVFLFWVCAPTPSQAQNVTTTDLSTAGTFLENCGLKEGVPSKKNVEAMKANPNASEALRTGLSNITADYVVCVAYIEGVIAGWKEGHEQGVVVAHFPQGIPDDLDAARSSLPPEEKHNIHLAIEIGQPCFPEHLTLGQLRETVVSYIRDETTKNPLMNTVRTARFIPRALLQAFPCPVSKGKVQITSDPDGAEVYVDGSFLGNTPVSLKLNSGKHVIRLSSKGFTDWSKETVVQEDSEVRLIGKLEKQ